MTRYCVDSNTADYSVTTVVRLTVVYFSQVLVTDRIPCRRPVGRSSTDGDGGSGSATTGTVDGRQATTKSALESGTDFVGPFFCYEDTYITSESVEGRYMCKSDTAKVELLQYLACVRW